MDARAFASSAGLAAALLGLGVILTALTDEGGVAWSERVARSVPLAPVCAAVAMGLALAGPSRRGEGRALEALGRSPFGTGLWAALGPLFVAVTVAGALLLDARIPVHTFFPAVQAAGTFRFDDGVFTSVQAGWHVMRDGSVSLPAAGVTGNAAPLLVGPPHARATAALLTFVASAAFVATVLATRQRAAFSWGRASLFLLATAAASVLALQAAAAGRAPALVALAPSTVLFVGAAWAIVREEWQPTLRGTR